MMIFPSGQNKSETAVAYLLTIRAQIFLMDKKGEL